MESNGHLPKIDSNTRMFRTLPRLAGAKLSLWIDFDGRQSYYRAQVLHQNGTGHAAALYSWLELKAWAAEKLMID